MANPHIPANIQAEWAQLRQMIADARPKTDHPESLAFLDELDAHAATQCTPGESADEHAHHKGGPTK